MKRDDIIEYSLDSHHSAEEGKAIRKKIWFVTALLTIITAAEVLLGVFWNSIGFPWSVVKISFILLTIVKAGYIVMVFMHLGDERKALRWVILAPYALFIMYLLFILLNDASVLYNVRQALGL
jgi:cytochrome c oxidase subunit IV